MSKASSFKLVLTAARTGKTEVLNGVPFKEGNAEIVGTTEEHSGLIRYMGLSYAAFLEGSEELASAQKVKYKEPEKDEDNENKDPDPVLNEKLMEAIKKLSPENDDHWTQAGWPDMKALEIFYGASDITRAQVTAAAPGYNRKKATEDAAAK